MYFGFPSKLQAYEQHILSERCNCREILGNLISSSLSINIIIMAIVIINRSLNLLVGWDNSFVVVQD